MSAAAAQRGAGGERKALWCARRRIPLAGGLTRRLRRGSGTCRPMGRSHFSFDGERKVCKRKPAARRLREKGSYCPFCRRGSQCRAQWSWTVFTFSWSALVLAFFRRQNGRAFFPSLPIAALLPRSWRWTDSTNASWDVTAQVGWLRCIHKQTCFPTHSWW